MGRQGHYVPRISVIYREVGTQPYERIRSLRVCRSVRFTGAKGNWGEATPGG